MSVGKITKYIQFGETHKVSCAAGGQVLIQLDGHSEAVVCSVSWVFFLVAVSEALLLFTQAVFLRVEYVCWEVPFEL